MGLRFLLIVMVSWVGHLAQARDTDAKTCERMLGKLKEQDWSNSIVILDTNVLINSPRAVFAFPKARVVLPLTVIDEFVAKKDHHPRIDEDARHLGRFLDDLLARNKTSSVRGLRLRNDSTVEIDNGLNLKNSPGIESLAIKDPDNRIVLTATQFLIHQSKRVVIVSDDRFLRIKAASLGIEVVPFLVPRILSN